MISLASLGWGDDPPIPPESRRTGVVRGSRQSKHQDRTRIASALMISLASLGWGDDPPIPPESRRTGVVRGSRQSKHQDRTRIASASAASLTTYHSPPTTHL